MRLSEKPIELKLRLIKCIKSKIHFVGSQRYLETRSLQETQDELTTELVDLKDKYREVVELLRDAQEDLRRSRKRSYPGMGKQTGMFTSLPLNKGNQLKRIDSFTVELWLLSNPEGRLTPSSY